MDNVYVYLIDLPNGVDEMVYPCLDGYTVYIDKNIASNQQAEKLAHAVHHILNDDFEKYDVQQIEREAH